MAGSGGVILITLAKLRYTKYIYIYIYLFFCFLFRPFFSQQAVAVEKPVAASVEEILECHRICKANHVPLYCCFQRLFSFVLRLIRRTWNR